MFDTLLRWAQTLPDTAQDVPMTAASAATPISTTYPSLGMFIMIGGGLAGLVIFCGIPIPLLSPRD